MSIDRDILFFYVCVYSYLDLLVNISIHTYGLDDVMRLAKISIKLSD